MATKRGTKKSAKRQPKRRSAARPVSVRRLVPPPADELDSIDSCGGEVRAVDVTADDALPAAVGGLAVDSFGGDDACGCDVEFDDCDATADEELPPAHGGVE